jgi:hypothetical protein
MSTQNTNIKKNIKNYPFKFPWLDCLFSVLIHSIIPLLLLMKCILILSIKKLKLRIYFQMLLEITLETYDDVLIIHNNNLSTFVPAPLFDENFMGVINTIPRF